MSGPIRSHYQPGTPVNEYTVDARVPGTSFKEHIEISEETVEPARFTRAEQKANMGYYDEDGKLRTLPINANRCCSQ